MYDFIIVDFSKFALTPPDTWSCFNHAQPEGAREGERYREITKVTLRRSCTSSLHDARPQVGRKKLARIPQVGGDELTSNCSAAVRPGEEHTHDGRVLKIQKPVDIVSEHFSRTTRINSLVAHTERCGGKSWTRAGTDWLGHYFSLQLIIVGPCSP